MPASPSHDSLAGGIDGAVLVIGTGLIGTSVALSLRRAGVDVLLSDVNPEHLAVAQADKAVSHTKDFVELVRDEQDGASLGFQLCDDAKQVINLIA